jgi:hypothetical protein
MTDMNTFVYEQVEPPTREKTADVIWIIPSFYYSAAYLETLFGLPVFEIPHLWSPLLLEERALSLSKVDASALYFNTKKNYKKIQLILLEPNIHTCKTTMMGLVAGEYIYKRRPDLLEGVYLANLPKNAAAKAIVKDLTVPIYIPSGYREMDQILLAVNSTDAMPIFVCHQLYHSLNYLYYECLYYGYPLVHNSPDLANCGYFYDGFDIEGCVAAIMSAYEKPVRDSTIAIRYLERVNPFNVDVQSKWKQAISSLESEFENNLINK